MKSVRLICFVHTAEQESFSAVAMRLNTQVSSVARHISSLEDEMGARLFNRSRKRITLTEAGSVFLPHAKRILQEERHAHEAINGLQALPSGELKLSVTRAFGEYWLAPRLGKFLDLYPQVTVNVDFDDQRIDLGEGGIDLSIRIGHLEDSDLIATKIHQNQYRIVGSPEYFKKNGMVHSLDELEERQFIKFCAAKWTYLRVLGGRERQIKVRGRIKLNTVAAVHQMALNGAGLTMLPTWVIGDDLARGRLQAVLKDNSFTPYQYDESAVYALYLEKRFLAPKVRAFLDFLKSESTGTT
ncbi:LysR family transcriptional regulator [Flexibacterium corallicola]|uniref:LysR family transcriptional regulator n=1 Tax=Flexibacterium corallicola TaxID=3037259 RepID=UPI00286F5AD3|nr:LysR substrate-binding domain-containing protein [Pseudovibrio sp. M1P-2-3]